MQLTWNSATAGTLCQDSSFPSLSVFSLPPLAKGPPTCTVLLAVALAEALVPSAGNEMRVAFGAASLVDHTSRAIKERET